ncbi:MAG: hypothetical protein JRF24_10835 [Deltaproteobacteria bacterium]|nr:hypothetical protein [Deltaproteobacteria bacterium]
MKSKIELLGHVPYSPAVTHAMVAGKSIVEFAQDKTTDAISKLWHQLAGYLK